MEDLTKKDVTTITKESNEESDLVIILKFLGVLAIFPLFFIQIHYTIDYLLVYYKFFISIYFLHLIFIIVESSAIFGLLMLYHRYLDKHGKNIPPRYDGKTDVMGMATYNGIGTKIWGGFRFDGESIVGYIFFCILVPIIPLVCVRYSQGSIGPRHRDGASRIQRSNLTIYGTEKWKLSETIMILFGSIIAVCAFLIIIEVLELIF